MEKQVEEKLALIPSSPGVYLMKGADGRILYVGKARDLKKRVGSYFAPGRQKDLKTTVLAQKISDIETILTLTEKEALILESNLIKKYRPHYNVVLRDDKQYPWIRIDIKSAYPNLSVVRKVRKDDALYFGPFASGRSVKETIKFIHRTFKLRKCSGREVKKRERPCLNHQMGLCLGPCAAPIAPQKYKDQVNEVILFLKGRMPELVKQVEDQMMEASRREEFEEAIEYRDRLFALNKTLEKQIAVTTDFVDRDVVGLAKEHGAKLIAVLFVRGGYVLGSHCYFCPEAVATDREALASFVKQYYDDVTFIPREILMPQVPEDKVLLEDRLAELKGGRVRIVQPKRGEKVRLLEMANQNAKKALEDRLSTEFSQDAILEQVQKRLMLTRKPERIECFDLSNLSGTEGVGAMVVFVHGKAQNSEYRKYKIKTSINADDYGMLREVLTRRYGGGGQAHFQSGRQADSKAVPKPDLLVVDGGKGQLGVALEVVYSVGLAGSFDMIAIAKKDQSAGETEDKIYKPNRKNHISCSRYPQVLLFVQRIRDEAHRYVISYQRKRRQMAYRRSPLDSVVGIGPKKRRTLLKHFGSVKRIRQATVDELCSVPGITKEIAYALKEAISYKTQ